MDCAEGQVVGILGELALVTTRRSAACESCSQAGGCDALSLSSNAEQTVEAFNELGARVGDRVRVDITPGGLLAVSALLYMFPVLAAVLGGAVGNRWGAAWLGWSADAAAFAFLTAGLALSLGTLKVLHPRLARKRSLRLNVTEILPPGPGPAPVEGSERG